jgi:hypothetical protein
MLNGIKNFDRKLLEKTGVGGLGTREEKNNSLDRRA